MADLACFSSIARDQAFSRMPRISCSRLIEGSIASGY